VNAPPIKGPHTDAIPYIAPRRAPYLALFSSGTDNPIMMKLPANIPADPIPAIALPTMRAVELGEAPQMVDPISKIMMATRYAHLRLKSVKNLPHKS
jgi:hypothetical protein